MAGTASQTLQVAFESPAQKLTLQYLPEDNKLPSEIEQENDRSKAVEGGCSYVGPQRSPAEEQAYKEAQCYKDQLAWPVRRLRLYPATSALYRATYGTVRELHIGEEVRTQLLQVSGSASVSLEFEGTELQLIAIALFDAAGNRVYPTMQYREGGVVILGQEVWGLIEARYRVRYRVVELTTVPTGQDYEVMVIAYASGEVANAMVNYELKECDSGGVIGAPCDGGGGNTSDVPDPEKPVTPARYEITALHHDAKGKVGESFKVAITMRNINGIEGSGAVEFEFLYGGVSTSGSFSCGAYGYTTINLTVTPTEEGSFTTRAMVPGDWFSQKSSTVQITDGEEEAEVWTEVEREMSDVDVEGVLIKRIEKVTLERDDGSQVQFVFDNSGVS